MTEQLHMPPFAGTAEWLGSEPLGPAELRGHVVVVNFWTLTCINWLRQEPYVRAWSQAYRGDGLVVIGVHTPECAFEHEIDRIRQAIEERGIDYPVAVDNEYEIWSAFDNHYWPALYFIDEEGSIRDQHFGEGRYEESERIIQQLLGVQRELVSVKGAASRRQPTATTSRHPRRISATGAASGSRQPTMPSARAYELPKRLPVNHWALAGDWTIGSEDVVLGEAGGSIAFRFHARDAHLVLSAGARAPIPFRVLLDGEAAACQQGSTSTRTEPACSGTAACTSSYANARRSTSGRSRSHFSNPVPRRTCSRSASRGSPSRHEDRSRSALTETRR